jgi:hypothetical protein
LAIVVHAGLGYNLKLTGTPPKPSHVTETTLVVYI